MDKYKRERRGQILPILALIVGGLLAVGALGIDVLYMYWGKDRLQNATDASALAGATYLTTVTFTGGNPACVSYSANNAQNAACTYALNNGVGFSEIQSITPATDGNSITVSTSRLVPALFMRVFGYSQYTVTATATATLQTLASANGVIPIGLDFATPYTYGQAITMHFGGVGAGNWQGLSLQSLTNGSNGSNAFRQNLGIGCNCTVSLGDSLSVETGATVGPIQQGVSQRTTAGQSVDPAGTWQAHSLDDPRATLVALVDWVGCVGSGCTGTVKGFAEVWITGTGSGKSATDVSAVFIREVQTGTVGPGAISAGALHAVLLQ
jgi:Flp pilus assembly protein TadG